MQDKNYDENVNYKELYFKLFNKIEDTINELIEVQRQCEEIYISAGEEETEKE